METWKKIWSKRHSIRLSECWCYGSLRLKEYHGVAFPNQLIEIENSFGTGYVDEEGYMRMLEHFTGRIKREGFDHVLGMAEQEYQAFIAYTKTIDPAELASLSTEALAAKFSEFLEKEDHWMHFMWPVFALDEGLTPAFQQYIESLPENERDEVTRIVLTPAKQTAAGQYHTDILTLLSENLSPEDKEKRIAELAKKYQYFPVLNMDEGLLPIEDVRAMVEKSAAQVTDPAGELAKEAAAEHECAQAFEAYIATLSQATANLLVGVKHIGYLREYRNDVRQESYVYARELYREVGRRAGLGLSEVIYCTRVELLAFLSEGKPLPSSAEIEQRRSYTRLFCDGTTVTHTWKKEEGQAAAETEGITEVKGTIAYKGLVRGTARVILDVAKEGGAFEEGDILVSTTTNLAFVPLMGKAAAIVTEEGGLLTHTAIVARELKKPCVIGTRIATKVFKSGDMVEVDAEKGVVRKI